MSRICYVEKSFQRKTLQIIGQANEILREYAEQGFELTLRQLYYQFVARDLIPNNQRSYQRLGSIVNDARLAGYLDWERIIDRTRSVESRSHWESPAEIIESCADAYHIDFWEDQKYHVEVWIEKDALVSVIERVCYKFDLHYLSCRGYTSQSEMWRASLRLINYKRMGKTNIILHFGDHDPSGIDMSRDIVERLQTFGSRFDFQRIALNMDQIEQYNPPPNFAKATDSRFDGYYMEFGEDSWELDALEPSVISQLIEDTTAELIDWDKWEAKQEQKDEEIEKLKEIAENFRKE